MKQGIKTKGNKYENELAKYLSDKTGLHITRSPLSGGGLVGLPGTADLIGTPDLHVEAKRTESFSAYKSIEQAESSTSKTGTRDVPIVISRKNRMPTGSSLCVMRLDDFADLYLHYLTTHGYVKEEKIEEYETHRPFRGRIAYPDGY